MLVPHLSGTSTAEWMRWFQMASQFTADQIYEVLSCLVEMLG
jgi:hypothetical protein